MKGRSQNTFDQGISTKLNTEKPSMDKVSKLQCCSILPDGQMLNGHGNGSDGQRTSRVESAKSDTDPARECV